MRTRNGRYLDELEDRAEARAETDWGRLNRERIDQLASTRGRGRRAQWATWNPQAAYRAMDAGTVRGITQRLEAEELARLRGDLSHAHLTQEELRARGMFPHPKPFRWPEKRTPAELNALEKPSEWRIEELQRPFEEPNARTAGPRDARPPEGKPSFEAITHSDVFFDADLIHYRSVHLVQESDFEELRAREQQLWKSKVVVDNVNFRSIVPSSGKGNQVDKVRGILKDEPRTLALKKTHVRPAPVSMQLQMRWKQPAQGFQRTDDPDQMYDGDFARFVGRQTTQVNKVWTTRDGAGAEQDVRRSLS